MEQLPLLRVVAAAALAGQMVRGKMAEQILVLRLLGLAAVELVVAQLAVA